jgi:hypothetical protein
MRKASLLVLLVLFSLICIGPVFAQDTPLKKLTKINLSYVEMSEYGKSIGITDEVIGNQLLVGIKRDLPRVELAHDQTSSRILISVGCVEATQGLAVCETRIELKRPVLIHLDDGTLTEQSLASVWTRHQVSSAGSAVMAEHVRQFLSQSLTEFAADYYKQNPN